MSRSSAREALAVIGAFGALAVGTTWPLILRLGDALPITLARGPLLNSLILAWDADRLLHGLQRWWNLPIFHPAYTYGLAFSENLLGIALFTAPIQFFSARWQGFWFLPQATYLELHGEGDDLRDVWIDDELVIRRTPPSDMHTQVATLTLSAWIHQISSANLPTRPTSDWLSARLCSVAPFCFFGEFPSRSAHRSRSRYPRPCQSRSGRVPSDSTAAR